MSNQSKYTNHLANQTSPYLLQHSHNPVDWYAWTLEAIDKAKRENKPIFLSIGYAACHWCHVMAHESFEDEATARFMNEHFVNIKVDREERPDLDSIYMNAVVALTGSGGWPMSVFLTPDGKPFFGGTYFPKTRRYGMPAFMDVLQGIANAWQNQRADIEHNGAQLQQALESTGVPRNASGEVELQLDERTLEVALHNLARSFDGEEGGWGGAPKFPQPMTLEFLIRVYSQTRDELVLRMITLTLNQMARGGMYDQLGGGFHRYSTDDHWLVPHFEKMLYDNAQLARVYLHAYQITGDEFYKRITTEILDYVAREMLDAPSTGLRFSTRLASNENPQSIAQGFAVSAQPNGGGFYSSQDADSEGEEGKFFVWTPDEIRAAIGGSSSGLLIVSKTKQDTNDAQVFMDAYGVTVQGNFEGKNILHRVRDNDVLAAMHNLDESEIERKLNEARQKLFNARERRVKPARDEKILTSWNGLMLAAFAEAARVLKRADYRSIATRNAEFLLNHLREADGRLKRSYKDGQARLNGYLEDYANLAEGLLTLYETTFEEKYFVAARELADQILAHFTDERGREVSRAFGNDEGKSARHLASGFFDTSDDHEALVVRPKDVQDNATPSGSAMATLVLFKLAAYTGEARYADAAEAALAPLQPALAQAPTAFAWWLCALDFGLIAPREIALVGEDVQPLLDVVSEEYRPNQVVAWKRGNEDSAIALLEGRTMLDGKATAYVCEHFTCQMPVTTPDALAAQLNT